MNYANCNDELYDSSDIANCDDWDIAAGHADDEINQLGEQWWEDDLEQYSQNEALDYTDE